MGPSATPALGRSHSHRHGPIVKRRPFDSRNRLEFLGDYSSGVQFDLDTLIYHSDALLLALYHSPGVSVATWWSRDETEALWRDVPRTVIHTVLSQLLPGILPGFEPASLADKITGVIDERP